MRLSVIGREEIDDWQLTQLLGADLEYRFAAALAILASVDDNVGSESLGAEFLFIVAEKLDGLVVVEGTLVVPGSRVDAGEREVLVPLLAQQAQESHLHRAHRFVRNLGSTAHVGVPVFFAGFLTPGNVGHLGRLRLGEDARLA